MFSHLVVVMRFFKLKKTSTISFRDFLSHRCDVILNGCLYLEFYWLQVMPCEGKCFLPDYPFLFYFHHDIYNLISLGNLKKLIPDILKMNLE